jgi:hypothetical protein
MTAPALAPYLLRSGAFDAVRGRPTGRGRPSGDLHAVPRTDRTRTALCGARVGGPGRPWGDTRPGTCPDCAGLLQTG